MAEYIEYHPLKFWLDPASIAEIVAHIQTYLVNNPINSTTEIETIIHDYLIAHPDIIGGVRSINGETGEVVLTADNISGGENVTIKDVLDSLQDQIDDIVASIPSDYQQLIDDVSDLKSAIDDLSVGEYPFSLIPNKYINVQTGAEQNYNGWSATPFIPIVTQLKVVSIASLSYSALYDSDKNWIGKPVVRAGVNYYSPTDGAFIRLSGANADMAAIKAYSLDAFSAEYTDAEVQKLVGYEYQTSLNFKRGSYVNMPGCKIDDLAIAMNGVAMDFDSFKNRLRLSKNEYSHDATLVNGGNGFLYCVHTISPNVNHDSPGWQDARVELSKTADDYSAFSSTQTVSFFPVAKNGDIVGSSAITSGCGVANMVKIGSTTLRIVFSAQLDDGKWYELYRDFNTSTETFGNIGICSLNGAAFTADNLMTILGVTGTLSFISLNAQIADSGSGYFVGACIQNALKNGAILSSTDLISFDVWLNPTDISDSDAMFEGACYVKNESLYYALRQITSTKPENEKQMILCKIDIATKSITDQTKIYDAGSRPFWIDDDGTLYLLHSISNRNRLEFLKINEDNIGSSQIVCHGGIFQCSYPSVLKNANGYWICGTGNGFTQVFLWQFGSFKAYSVTEAHSLLVGLLRLNN